MHWRLKEEDQIAIMKNVGRLYRESLETQKKGGIITVFKEKVDIVLEAMSKEYALIIKKEFLEENEEEWYFDFFGKKEYLSYKKGAITKFLHCLYEKGLL